MIHISKDEVLKIAAISNILLSQEEVGIMQNELKTVLNYAQRVIDAVGNIEENALVQYNIFRDDVVYQGNSPVLLSLAPEVMSDYFVVPLVLDQQ